MNDLSQATAAVNAGRALELEETNIATVNDQIGELAARIAGNEGAIEAMRDAIRDKQRENREHKAQQARLRQRRAVFKRAAFQLREIDEP